MMSVSCSRRSGVGLGFKFLSEFLVVLFAAGLTGCGKGGGYVHPPNPIDMEKMDAKEQAEQWEGYETAVGRKLSEEQREAALLEAWENAREKHLTPMVVSEGPYILWSDGRNSDFDVDKSYDGSGLDPFYVDLKVDGDYITLTYTAQNEELYPNMGTDWEKLVFKGPVTWEDVGWGEPELTWSMDDGLGGDLGRVMTLNLKDAQMRGYLEIEDRNGGTTVLHLVPG